MQIFVMTFGMSQYGGLLRYSYVEVECESEEQAMKAMHRCFGNKWSCVYTEEYFKTTMSSDQMRRLARIDRDANVLLRFDEEKRR